MLLRCDLGPSPFVCTTSGRLSRAWAATRRATPKIQLASSPAPGRRIASLPGEDQERHLRGVLGIVGVVEHIVADTKDHRAVPFDQGSERELGTSAAPW